MIRFCLFALCLTAAGCLRAADPPAPSPPLASGLDPESFDRSVRPQDDLFHHVNGAWLRTTEIPADKASYGAFDILFDKASRSAHHRRRRRQNGGEGARLRRAEDRRLLRKLHERGARRRAWLAPMKAELDAIEALKTKTDVARHFAHFFKLNLINPMIGYVDGDAQQPA